MLINGREIAAGIAEDLQIKIAELKQHEIIAKLAVALVGKDLGSEKYVEQKVKLGLRLGIKVAVSRLENSAKTESLISLVKQWNNDPAIHGIIIQRPVPLKIVSNELNNLPAREKDVDGFHPDSLFDPPIVLAVMKKIEKIQQVTLDKKSF